MVSVGTDEVFFVENEWPVHDEIEWDEAVNTLSIGQYVRMKRLLPGEQVVMSVNAALQSAVSIGDIMAPAAGGTVAA